MTIFFIQVSYNFFSRNSACMNHKKNNWLDSAGTLIFFLIDMTLGIRILVILSMHRKQITQYIGGHLLAVHQPVFFWRQKDNIKIEN